jgi:hypothetical protein
MGPFPQVSGAALRSKREHAALAPPHISSFSSKDISMQKNIHLSAQRPQTLSGRWMRLIAGLGLVAVLAACGSNVKLDNVPVASRAPWTRVVCRACRSPVPTPPSRVR